MTSRSCGGGDARGTPGDFGPIVVLLDQALSFVAIEDFFWIDA